MAQPAAPERDRGSFADVEGFPKADQSGKKGKVRRTQIVTINCEYTAMRREHGVLFIMQGIYKLFPKQLAQFLMSSIDALLGWHHSPQTQSWTHFSLSSHWYLKLT